MNSKQEHRRSNLHINRSDSPQKRETESDQPQRLQKFLAAAGVASRRSCEQMIADGRVKVNGIVVTQQGTKVHSRSDEVLVDGHKITAVSKYYYYLLNKPLGVVSTASDPQGRPTVTSLITDCPTRLYPVGRLDIDTKGLLLMTNDGALTNALLHPSREIDKIYRAQVSARPTAQALRQLRKGIMLEDGPTQPATVTMKEDTKGVWLTIIIHEGRNRQVRRMCEAVGCPVIKLERIGFAFLRLRRLKPGDYRSLTPDEIKQLKQLAGK